MHTILLKKPIQLPSYQYAVIEMELVAVVANEKSNPMESCKSIDFGGHTKNIYNRKKILFKPKMEIGFSLYNRNVH